MLALMLSTARPLITGAMQSWMPIFFRATRGICREAATMAGKRWPLPETKKLECSARKCLHPEGFLTRVPTLDIFQDFCIKLRTVLIKLEPIDRGKFLEAA